MFLMLIKLIVAVLLILPRGYLLAYVIDRSKCFSFGFKLFVGWIFGIVAFTLDLFSANALGGFELLPWLYLFSAFGQIFGLEFVIFILERKILLPNFNNFLPFWRKQLNNLKSWNNFERFLAVILLMNLVVWSALIFIQAINFQLNYDLNNDLETIYFGKNISLNVSHYFYPPADTLFKAWLAVLAGGIFPAVPAFVWIFYYLIFLAIFYNYLPSALSRVNKLLAVIFASNLPLVYFICHFSSVQWLAAIFLFIIVSSFFNFLFKSGNSYLYFGGIALAFAVWTKTAYFAVVFPLVLIFTFILLAKRIINYKQWLIFWFWPVVTVFPWLSFVVLNRINIFLPYFQSLTINELSTFIIELIPAIWLMVVFYFAKLFVKIKS